MLLYVRSASIGTRARKLASGTAALCSFSISTLLLFEAHHSSSLGIYPRLLLADGYFIFISVAHMHTHQLGILIK